MSVIQAGEWQDWAQHPATQQLLKDLRESKQATMESWAGRAYVGESLEETALKNATALGGVQVLDQIIDIIEAKAMGEVQ